MSVEVNKKNEFRWYLHCGWPDNGPSKMSLPWSLDLVNRLLYMAKEPYRHNWVWRLSWIIKGSNLFTWALKNRDERAVRKAGGMKVTGHTIIDFEDGERRLRVLGDSQQRNGTLALTQQEIAFYWKSVEVEFLREPPNKSPGQMTHWFWAWWELCWVSSYGTVR